MAEVHGTAYGPDAQVRWASSDESVVSVRATSGRTAEAETGRVGAATVTASLGDTDYQGTLAVEVAPLPPDRVKITVSPRVPS
jgi:hypothetical protein